MAEALLLARMPRGWRGAVRVRSAGTGAFAGMPASRHAESVLGEIGVDLSAHRARRLSVKMVEEADLVVVMARAHRDEILESAPWVEGKLIVLGELDSSRGDPDIADPIGGEDEDYRRTRRELERLIDRLIDYLAEKYELGK